VARARGVIYDLEGNQISTYAWGPGITANNQVEAYAFLQGMSKVIILGIKELTIIKNSQIITKSLVFKKPLKDLQLASIISKVTKIIQNLSNHYLYHVLGEKDGKVDTMTNEASSLPQEALKKMGGGGGGGGGGVLRFSISPKFDTCTNIHQAWRIAITWNSLKEHDIKASEANILTLNSLGTPRAR
jgi:hypothetical protein